MLPTWFFSVLRSLVWLLTVSESLSTSLFQAPCETGKAGIFWVLQTRELRPKGDWLPGTWCMSSAQWSLEPGSCTLKGDKMCSKVLQWWAWSVPSKNNDLPKLSKPSYRKACGPVREDEAQKAPAHVPHPTLDRGLRSVHFRELSNLSNWCEN